MSQLRSESTSSPEARALTLDPSVEAAVDALRLDPERTRAGVLCVAAGMAVIVSLVAIVSGGRREMLKSIEAAGPSNVFLKSRLSAGGGVLTTRERDAAASRLPGLVSAAGIRVVPGEVSLGALREKAPVYGVSAEASTVFPLRAARGRTLGPLDFRERSRSALLGAALGTRLARNGDPVGRTVFFGGETYDVVGVLATLASDAGGGSDLAGVDWDRGLVVPLGAEPGGVPAPDEDYPVDLVALRLKSPGDAERASRLLTQLLEERGQRGLAVTTPTQALEQYRAARRSFDRVALLVSVLATLSAAFGITNLLRASVKARALEIGIRRAVGARQRDIRRQFLVEGLFLGVLGGAAGIVLGLALSVTLLARAGWHPAFDLPLLVSLVFGSALFGIVSGLAPAADAARLDPGAALRVE